MSRSLRNHLLRAICQAYPFSKGRYRLMMTARNYIKRQEEVIEDLHGKYRFALDLNNDGLQNSFYFFIPAFYEKDVQRYVKERLKPGMTAFDVGAHLGLLTILMADCVGEAGKVHCFEPEENNFARLRRNLDLNELSQVVANQMAVSSKTSSDFLQLHEMSSGHSLIKNSEASAVGQAVLQEVNTVKLDEYIEREEIEKIDLMKIDAEKSEQLVLEGANNSLQKGIIRELICEIHSTSLTGAAGDDQIRRMLYEYGYKSYVLDTRLTPKPYLSEFLPEEPVVGLQNFLFRRESSNEPFSRK